MKTPKKKLNSILLIDDDEVTNFYNQHLIEKLQVAEHVHCEQNGKAGLRYLTEDLEKGGRKPDLILLDINMPIMNGFEFLEAYEQLDPQAKAGHLIVMLTSSMLTVDKNRASAFPSLSGFYTKPLSEEQILEIVDRFFPDILES